jgi:hypothetical protein
MKPGPIFSSVNDKGDCTLLHPIAPLECGGQSRFSALGGQWLGWRLEPPQGVAQWAQARPIYGTLLGIFAVPGVNLKGLILREPGGLPFTV